MDKKQGALDGLLAPFASNLVNPDGQVTDMMHGDYEGERLAERKRLEEEERKRLAAAAAERSAMEAAAANPEIKEMSGWNPFVWLFGQPGESGGGLLGK